MKALRYLVVFLLAELVACGPQSGDLTEADNGSRVTLEQGQELVITLESNPTTGYSWHVMEVDADVLKQVGEIEYKQATGSDGLVGAGGTETIRFEAVATGEATLTLGYFRSWEDEPPVETFTLTVVIK